MALQLIQTGNALPFSYPVDPSAEFQAGAIGQLTVIGNDIFVTVSDGRAPIGILDDIKSASFTRPQIDEVNVVQVPSAPDGYGQLISTMDVEKTLEFANISLSSFRADIPGIILNEVNGSVIVPAGTPLNFDQDGDGIPDSVRIISSYIYFVPNIPGDDSTVGSGRATIWFQRGIFQTDQFDTTQPYPINATLYVGEDGKLTSRQPGPTIPGVAMVTGPPSALVNNLEFLWF